MNLQNTRVTLAFEKRSGLEDRESIKLVAKSRHEVVAIKRQQDI